MRYNVSRSTKAANTVEAHMLEDTGSSQTAGHLQPLNLDCD